MSWSSASTFICPLQTSRNNREEVAKLLEENASLHSRLAAKTMESVESHGPARMTKMFEAPGASG